MCGIKIISKKKDNFLKWRAKTYLKKRLKKTILRLKKYNKIYQRTKKDRPRFGNERTGLFCNYRFINRI